MVTPMPNPHDLMTVREAAEAFRVSPVTVRRWAHKGRISIVTLPGGTMRVRRADIEAYLAPPVPQGVAS